MLQWAPQWVLQWSGDYVVLDIEQLEEAERISDVKPRRIKEIIIKDLGGDDPTHYEGAEGQGQGGDSAAHARAAHATQGLFLSLACCPSAFLPFCLPLPFPYPALAGQECMNKYLPAPCRLLRQMAH